MADSNSISGTVKLIDQESGATVGTYAINRSFAASGLVGIAMTADAEGQMSDAFGGEVCKSVFNAKP